MAESDITEKDLEKAQAANDKLREQIADEEAKAAERRTQAERQILAAQLAAEKASLEVQLSRAKAANKVSAVKEGADGPLQQAKAQLQAAQAQADQPVGPVDTNAGTSGDDKNEE